MFKHLPEKKLKVFFFLLLFCNAIIVERQLVLPHMEWTF